MIFAQCPKDYHYLIEIETCNIFVKHAGCLKCGTVYVSWGDKVTPCETPERCVIGTWRTVLSDRPKPSPIISGPHGMGLL
jgi:hypothetical protein